MYFFLPKYSVHNIIYLPQALHNVNTFPVAESRFCCGAGTCFDLLFFKDFLEYLLTMYRDLHKSQQNGVPIKVKKYN